jgi:hypothetical protein
MDEFAIIYRSKNTIRPTDVEPVPESLNDHQFTIIAVLLCCLVPLVLCNFAHSIYY